MKHVLTLSALLLVPLGAIETAHAAAATAETPLRGLVGASPRGVALILFSKRFPPTVARTSSRSKGKPARSWCGGTRRSRWRPG